MVVGAVARFERLFREAAGLTVDKDDLKRFQDFIVDKTADLLLAAERTAEANDRDVVAPQDLPLTKGLEELAIVPPMKLAVGDDTSRGLPLVAGGIAVALAHMVRLVEPDQRHPSGARWERATRMFDLVV